MSPSLLFVYVFAPDHADSSVAQQVRATIPPMSISLASALAVSILANWITDINTAEYVSSVLQFLSITVGFSASVTFFIASDIPRARRHFDIISSRIQSTGEEQTLIASELVIRQQKAIIYMLIYLLLSAVLACIFFILLSIPEPSWQKLGLLRPQLQQVSEFLSLLQNLCSNLSKVLASALLVETFRCLFVCGSRLLILIQTYQKAKII